MANDGLARMVRAKREWRAWVWGDLLKSGASRFPGVEGRVPNFVGSERAAELLRGSPWWKRARVVACSPHLPLRPLRRAALDEGKLLFVARPGLADEEPFLRLEASELQPRLHWPASSLSGAEQLGRPVGLDALEPVDLLVTGAVAVTPKGALLGRGGGQADLEWALLREARAATARTPVVTVVHPAQVVVRGKLPVEAHDVSLDGYATPKELVRCKGRRARPGGFLWELLEERGRAPLACLAGREP